MAALVHASTAPLGGERLGRRELRGAWVARLQRFVAERPERCDLCGAILPAGHAHLLDVEARRAVCACRGCAMVVGSRPDGRYRDVPPRGERLADFRLNDAEWAGLQIPIGLAMLHWSTPHRGPLALYPGPAGLTESEIDGEAWAVLRDRNPVMGELAPDVEALLVNRMNGRRDVFRVSIDRGFALAALIRTQWRGIHGGDEVWGALDDFFDRLRGPATQAGSPAHG
jgi:hypothetical protein